jgi:hypothetical protein
LYLIVPLTGQPNSLKTTGACRESTDVILRPEKNYPCGDTIPLTEKSDVETNLCCVSVVGDGAVNEALLLVVGELDVAQPIISVVVHISNSRKGKTNDIKNIKWD